MTHAHHDIEWKNKKANGGDIYEYSYSNHLLRVRCTYQPIVLIIMRIMYIMLNTTDYSSIQQLNTGSTTFA